MSTKKNKKLLLIISVLFISTPLFAKETLPVTSSPPLTLRQKIGQMIMVGFHATTPQDKQVSILSQKIEDGLVGGVIFFRYNIENSTQTKKLTAHFNNLNTTHPLLLAVDQEGGRVQRLNDKNGFKDFKSAQEVGETLSVKQAHEHYEKMAAITQDAGFNVVFGPVVDLAHHPEGGPVNPVIGGLKRAFSSDPKTITKYAGAFIKAHHDHNILTSLKHFPGHGLAPSDTHIDLTDVTETYEADLELAPYQDLEKQGLTDMIMTAHVMMRNLDEKDPATLSATIIKELLRAEGYDGVVITDDLFMGAIQKNYDFKEIVLKAIEADVDILLFSINHAAQKGINAEDQKPVDAQLVDNIIDIVEEAIKSKRISLERIEKSYQRIVKMKEKLKAL